jgi:hypothetical protein
MNMFGVCLDEETACNNTDMFGNCLDGVDDTDDSGTQDDSTYDIFGNCLTNCGNVEEEVEAEEDTCI